MFKQNINEIVIVGMNKNMAHMGKFNTAQARRHIPFLFCFVRKSEHAVQRLPGLSGIFAAEKSDRANAHVDDAFIVRVDSKCAHVAVHDFRPGLAGIFAAIAAVKRHRCENNFRLVFTANQMLEGSSLEELTHRVHGTGTIFQHIQPTVVSDVVAERIHKTSDRLESSVWRLAFNSRPETLAARGESPHESKCDSTSLAGRM